nr:MAG TPA: hypothetical protein [Caudoviricetes sp.]
MKNIFANNCRSIFISQPKKLCPFFKKNNFITILYD